LYFDEVFDLNIISELGIKRIYGFTDTKDEANYIKKHVLDSICNFVEVIIKNSTVVPVDSSLNNKDTLKLYFFSAPYNMFFLKDQYNFIPFQFRPENVGYGIETYNYLVFDRSLSERMVNDLANSIEDFHKTIFYEAANHPEN